MLLKSITKILIIVNLFIISSCHSTNIMNKVEKHTLKEKIDQYQFTGIVINNEKSTSKGNKQLDILKIQITSSVNENLQPNTIIYAVVDRNNLLKLEINREYVFNGNGSYTSKLGKHYIKIIKIQDLI